MLSRLFRGSPRIDATEAARRLAAGELVLVDVRETAEWRSGHAHGARHVPLSGLGRHLEELATHGKPVAFVCRSGHRSTAACAAARRRGIEVVNVRGGMSAWLRAGLPVTRG